MEIRSLRKKICIEMPCENTVIKLPQDLLIEIFIRSSVRSLICAKCVCKQSHHLISNPKFELCHIQYQKNHNKGRLLLQYFKEETEQYSYALFDDETLVSDTYHDLDNFQLSFHGLHMEGPINGLYCLYNHHDRVILWNPALSEYKTFPLPHPHFLPHVKVDVGKIGFGTDSSTCDYKLLLIRRFLDIITNEGFPRIYVTMYNLSKNTWRLLDIGDFHICENHFFIAESSSSVNGDYYWWDCCGMVIAFNMGKEKFRHIIGPKLTDHNTFTGHLTLYNDKVALMLSKGAMVDIWLMLEEGVWIKQFTITFPPSREKFAVLGIWKNKLVLSKNPSAATSGLDPNSQIVLCNMNTPELRYMGPRGTDFCFRTSVYYESLVSVGCGTKRNGHRTSLNTLSVFLHSSSNPYINNAH